MKSVDDTNGPTAVVSASPERESTAEHLNALLEEALMQTFPASDPIAISITPARLIPGNQPLLPDAKTPE